MTGIFVVCASVAAVGVDYGWQPVAGGGIEYIIQIEPQMLDSLRAGQDIFSDLPRTASNIRSYRITSGTGQIPHHGEPLPEHEVNPPGPRKRSQVGPSLRGTAAATTDAERARAERPAGAVAEHQTDGHQADEERQPDEQGAALDGQGAALGGDLLPGDLLPGPVLEPPPSLVADDAARTEPAAGGHDHHTSPRRLVGSPSKPLNPQAATVAKKPSNPAAKASTKSTEASTRPTASRQADSAGSKKKSPGKPAAGKAAADPPSTASKQTSEQAGRGPSLTLLGLFASLGCNVFLLWIATGQRSRYRALARRLIP